MNSSSSVVSKIDSPQFHSICSLHGRRRIPVFSRGCLCAGSPGHEGAMSPWTPRAYAVDDPGLWDARLGVAPRRQTMTGQVIMVIVTPAPRWLLIRRKVQERCYFEALRLRMLGFSFSSVVQLVSVRHAAFDGVRGSSVVFSVSGEYDKSGPSTGHRECFDDSVLQAPSSERQCCDTGPRLTAEFDRAATDRNNFTVGAKWSRCAEVLFHTGFTDAEASGFHVTSLHSNMKFDSMKVYNPAQRAWTV